MQIRTWLIYYIFLSLQIVVIFKENKVKGNLLRIGEVPEDLLEQITEPIIGMEEPFHYRNKAQFPIGTDKDGPAPF